MRNQGLIAIGSVLIVAGLVFLLGNALDINVAAFCLPAGLILLGVVLLLRPRMIGPDTRSDVLFIGDIERAGQWAVSDEELWAFIGDIKYDLTKAQVPKGETKIRLNGFITDVEIFIPNDIGVTVDATSFVTSFTLPGQAEEDSFLAPVHWQSDNYKLADRTVRFEFSQFIGDITVRQF